MAAYLSPDPNAASILVLHGAGGVVVMTERTVRIVRFEHHDFARVIAQFNGLAIDVSAGEIRGGFADFHGVGADHNGQRGNGGVVVDFSQCRSSFR